LELTRTDAELGKFLVTGLPYLRAEIVYTIRHEMAQTIEDILARRLGLQMFDWRKSMEAAPMVGDLLAAELGWAAKQRDEAVASYIGKIASYLRTLGLAENAA
jgi:glycerol-3-phosphate dehydrogenase